MTSQSTSGDTISRSITVESSVLMLDHMKKQADSRGVHHHVRRAGAHGREHGATAPGVFRILHPVLRDDPA